MIHAGCTDEQCYENLANAVVVQAAQDYTEAVRKMMKHNSGEKILHGDRVYEVQKELNDARLFFLGKDIRRYTEVDGKSLLKRLDKELGN